MPYPPTVQGFSGIPQQVRLTLEQNQGEQLLLAETAGAATMSLTTQPNQAGMATTGAHLHVYIIGNPGSGNVIITGTNVAGSPLTSQTYHLAAAPQNAQGFVEFTTTEAFLTVSASGLALSAGLLPCQVMVFASPAGKYLIPCEADAEEHIGRFSPSDRRGILWKDFRVQQTHRWATLDKLDQSVYADQLWLLYMLITSNPTVTTVPAAPPTLLAATTKASTMTLTSAPSSPGMFLIFALTGNSATGTITLSGKDNYGNTVSETVPVAANNNTVYSTKRYSALTSPGANQFTTTGLSVGATIAVTGVFAWTYTGTWDGLTNTAKSTATIELFDGVQGVVMPFCYLSEGTFSWEKEKELTFSGKGEAQDFLIVGDPNPVSNYPSGTNPFATLAQPTAMPWPGFPAQFWVDALPGTPFTTQDGSFISLKIAISTGLKGFYSGDGMQRWSAMTYGGEPSVDLDAVAIYQNYGNYRTFFEQNNKFALGVQFQGTLLGSYGSSTYYEGIKFTFPVKVESAKSDRGKDPVEVTYKYITEYSLTELGYAFQMSMTSQIPPTYTS
jgi:hypothetical protein